jgi:hypothetical protein
VTIVKLLTHASYSHDSSFHVQHDDFSLLSELPLNCDWRQVTLWIGYGPDSAAVVAETLYSKDLGHNLEWSGLSLVTAGFSMKDPIFVTHGLA